MPVQSAMRCAVTTLRGDHRRRGGVCPGHLGELTRIVPFELADAVLEEAGGPGAAAAAAAIRGGLYFLLAMCLFPQAGYLGVWGKLTAGLAGWACRAVARRRCGTCGGGSGSGR